MNPNPMPAPPPRPQESGRSTGVIIGIVAVGVVGCCVFSTLAAVAVPSFVKFGARSKQAECKTNLKAIYVSQKAMFAEKDDYKENFAEIGFSPEPRRRYTYFMGDGAVLVADLPGATAPVAASALPPLAGGDPPGVFETCPNDCFFVAACASNLDSDATLDVWSISSVDRTAPSGEKILAGQPWNDVNDVTD